ncbi:hypothetical protein [Micromonospora sp. KC213]|uniref:hypothetical protein n=1 Tax=Micromonospora sp. KC213 TaxID=2530378 RepID=UPI001405477C|nr:hypothetical protein [Micromonospora sp. KC213]
MLALVACAAPPVLRIGELIELLQQHGWAACLTAAPTAATWIDRETMALAVTERDALTGDVLGLVDVNTGGRFGEEKQRGVRAAVRGIVIRTARPHRMHKVAELGQGFEQSTRRPSAV